MAPRAGIEPATIRLTVECSTAELPRNAGGSLACPPRRGYPKFDARKPFFAAADLA